MRCFTRVTIFFSRRLENHTSSISTSCSSSSPKSQSSIKTPPAMEAGVTDFLWSMEDIVAMAETNS
jgi:hypothetical protein